VELETLRTRLACLRQNGDLDTETDQSDGPHTISMSRSPADNGGHIEMSDDEDRVDQ
jgi:hypothetical protein